ncbi:hypothetical protein KAS50_02385 [bacterium]|nr:hypothetical protein [bacterium]
MNVKRWLLASLGVYVAIQVLDLIIHVLILQGCYEATADVWRSDMKSKMYIMYITSAIFSLLFVYIFTKGYEGKGIMEGVRYGLWMGLLISIPNAYGYYVTIDIPYSLAFSWWTLGTVEIIICGIVAASLYRPAAAAEPAPAEAPPSSE